MFGRPLVDRLGQDGGLLVGEDGGQRRHPVSPLVEAHAARPGGLVPPAADAVRVVPGDDRVGPLAHRLGSEPLTGLQGVAVVVDHLPLNQRQDLGVDGRHLPRQGLRGTQVHSPGRQRLEYGGITRVEVPREADHRLGPERGDRHGGDDVAGRRDERIDHGMARRRPVAGAGLLLAGALPVQLVTRDQPPCRRPILRRPPLTCGSGQVGERGGSRGRGGIAGGAA